MLSFGSLLGAILGAAWVTLLLIRRRRLIISDRGICDRELGLGWILWDEIEGVYPQAARGGETLHLRVRVSERLSRVLRRRWWPSSSGEPLAGALEVRMDLAGSDVTAVDVLQRMLTREPEGAAPISVGVSEWKPKGFH